MICLLLMPSTAFTGETEYKELALVELQAAAEVRSQTRDFTPSTEIADDAFSKWLKKKTYAKSVDHVDPVAEKIAEAVKPLAKDKSINLGLYGYSIKRARGKGAKGIVVARIEKK